jgi:hypothetical protein
MSKAGFAYSTPMDANNDPRWSGEEVTQAEIAVAVADVNCKKKTNLVGIRMAVDAAYQRAAIAANAIELKAVKTALARQATTAHAVLAAIPSAQR